MMGALLTTASTLRCPHGGIIMPITSNTTTQVGGAYAITSSDTLLVAGCPFLLPVISTPHPCTTVQWISTDTNSTIDGNATLSEDSVGLCLAADRVPQGSVIATAGQLVVTGQ